MVHIAHAVSLHRKSTLGTIGVAMFRLCIPAILLLPTAAIASTYTVTNLNDSGSGSLRLAITLANADPGSVVDLSALAGTIDLASELPTITASMTIQGPSNPALLTISGGGAHGVFIVNGSGASITVNISGLTVSRGANAANTYGYGSGLYLASPGNQTVILNISAMIFSGNTAPYGGSGITNDGSILNVINSVFTGNTTPGSGGGIYNNGTLHVSNSSFVSNYAGFSGSAIFNESTYAGIVVVSDSTFAENSTPDLYGRAAIFNSGGCSLTVRNSTFIGNLPANVGSIANAGTLSLTNTILVEPTSSSIQCASWGSGMCPAGPGGPDSNGNFDDVASNLKLFPLAYFGGPTPTVLPKFGSPVICAGSSAGAEDVNGYTLTSDQRGFRIIAANCPTGTVDSGSVQTDYLPVTNTNDTGTGSLRAAISSANTAGQGDITFATGVTGTIVLASELLAINANANKAMVNIVGPGANNLTISGTKNSRIVVNQGSLSLYGLTLANGNAGAYTDGTGGFGGAIFNSGTLAVNSVAFTGNSAGNGASKQGGAIYQSGNGTILDVTDSSFTNNYAASGSAIYNGSSAPISVSYSTFSGNASSSGGAIYNNSNGMLSIADSTFAGNIAGGKDGAGSGILNAGFLIVTNTLVQDDASGPECSTSIPGACPRNGDGLGNVVLSSDATSALSPLGSYGGSTPAIVPLPGSAAICGGLSSLIPAGSATDQRGYPTFNSTYTGYTANTPCVDSGALQSAYSAVQWVQQPSSTSPNANMFPAPTVEVLETNPVTGSADIVDGIRITLALNGSGSLSGGSATTSGGLATFNTLSVDTVGLGDTLSTGAITVVSNSTGTTTLPSQTSDAFNILATPTLAVQISAVGTFIQGQTAQWLVTMSNTGSSASTSGTTFFTDTLPAGYTVSGFGSTSGWSCLGAGAQTASCSSAQTVAAGNSYTPIQLIVNVPANSSTSVSDTAYGWGGGDPVHNSLATAASATSVVSVVSSHGSGKNH
jgi:hypothetical protein